MTAPLPKPEPGSGPVQDFKDAVYALYLAAGSPSPEDIRCRMNGNAVPSLAAIRDVISSPALSPSVQDVIAVVAALAPTEADRARDLWVRAASHKAPGCPVATQSPTDLGVHRAVNGTLPTYIVRPHDHMLRKVVVRALTGESAIAVLVSGSSSGKTRALYEALHWKAQNGGLADWQVWPSVHPTDARRMLAELPRVCPRTVVWLNEAQRYLIEPPPDVCVAIAAGLRALLADRSRSPVLVLGTLWPRYWEELTRTPQPGEPDPVDARLLLDGHGIPVPDMFSVDALTEAAASSDPVLAEAASRAEDAAVTQYLAGVPDLLQRYELAGPGTKAVIHAAMDARRLGHGEWLPKEFLRAAARAFLGTRVSRLLDRKPQWFEEVLDELTKLGRADTSILIPDGNGRFRLEDYLDHFGRRTRMSDFPSQPFWDAADHVIDVTSRVRLAHAAMSRFRLHIAANIYRMARNPQGLVAVATILAVSGEAAGIEYLAGKANSGAALTDFVRCSRFLDRSDRVRDERLLRRALALGDHRAYEDLAVVLESRGDRGTAELVVRQALEYGHWMPAVELAKCRIINDPTGANVLLDLLTGAERAEAQVRLVAAAERAGDAVGADRIARLARQEGNEEVDYRLSQLRAMKAERGEEVSRAAGPKLVLAHLFGLELRRSAWSPSACTIGLAAFGVADVYASGEFSDAEQQALNFAREGSAVGCGVLAWLRDSEGDRVGAEAIAMTAAELGHSEVLAVLVSVRRERGDHVGAEWCARHAAANGNAMALLAILQEDERLAAKDAIAGYASKLVARTRSSERKDALRLALEAVNAGPRIFWYDSIPEAWRPLIKLHQPHNLLTTGLAADGTAEAVAASDWSAWVGSDGHLGHI